MEPDRLEIPLFRPYKKLIAVTIRGKKFQIPENQIMLRAFQYLCPDTIPYGRYCWNEDCQYCRVSVKRPGAKKVTQALSCKLMVEEGMEILELADELTRNLRQLFVPASEETPQGEEPGARSQESEEKQE